MSHKEQLVVLWLLALATVAYWQPCTAVNSAKESAIKKNLEVLLDISEKYGIDKQDMFELVGKDYTVGWKAKNMPLVAIHTNVQEIFEKSTCRLRYLCGIGSTMRYYKRHIDPQLIRIANKKYVDLRALIHGIQTGECRVTYGDECRMTLKPAYKEVAKNPEPELEPDYM